MAVGFKRIGRVQVVSEQKIQIKNLYKIFGNNAEGVMDLVNDGISKQELLEDHGHVLGLPVSYTHLTLPTTYGV